MRAAAALVVIAAACRAPVQGPTPPLVPPVVVLVSADAEWAGVRAKFPAARVEATAYESFATSIGDRAVRFVHGGWGKIAAAASTQWVIDHYGPSLIVNLGTCGGLGDGVKEGEVILVDQAIVYDIVERMGDPAEAIRAYTTRIDLSTWPASLRSKVRVGHLASGDRDLALDDLAHLRDDYHAVAGDWESGAIAWVATRAHTRVIILRGVSDVIAADGRDPTYGAPAEWKARANATMAALVELFTQALPSIE